MPSNIDNGVKKRLNFEDITSKNADHIKTNSKNKLQLQFDQISENKDHLRLQIDQISTKSNCTNQIKNIIQEPTIEAYKKDPLFTHKLMPKTALKNSQDFQETSSIKSNLKKFDDTSKVLSVGFPAMA